MHVTLTELRYLIALDKERHFGRASQRACVSQPTLSVAVKKLESELGLTVFERSRGDAQVTAAGVKIIEQAYRILGEIGQLETIAEQSRDELAAPLKLGVIYTVGPYVLPHLIPELAERAPAMPLVIEENFTCALAQQLRNNELDAVIVATPFKLPGLAIWPLYDESFVVVMPRAHPWTHYDEISADWLARDNLLLLGPGHCFRNQVLELCPACREVDSGEPSHSGSSLETIRHMVASGLGVTVLPRSSISNLSAESGLLATRPFVGPAPTRRVVLAWRRSFPRTRAISTLRAAIMACEPQGVSLLAEADSEVPDDKLARA